MDLRMFSIDGGPTPRSLTCTLKVSPVCKDRVHNQNQHNQLNQFRRAMRMVASVLIVSFSICCTTNLLNAPLICSADAIMYTVVQCFLQGYRQKNFPVRVPGP